MKRGTAEWTRAIALLLNGHTLQVSDENGEWVIDDSFLLLVNAADEGVEFTLPLSPRGKPWCQMWIRKTSKIRLW